MAKIEMSFALYDSLLKTEVDSARILHGEVHGLCDFHDATVESVTGNDRRFLAVISHKDEKALREIIESTISPLAGSGVVFNGEVC